MVPLNESIVSSEKILIICQFVFFVHKRPCSYVLVNGCPRTSKAVLRAQETAPMALKRCNQNHECGVLLYSTSTAKNWNVFNILSNTLLPELEDFTVYYFRK